MGTVQEHVADVNNNERKPWYCHVLVMMCKQCGRHAHTRMSYRPDSSYAREFPV